MNITGAGLKDDPGTILLRWYHDRARPHLTTRTTPALLRQIDDQGIELQRLIEGQSVAEVAFLGSTTAGKSTTINALLQRRLLPENRIGSTTAAKVEIRHGPRERLLIHYADDARLKRDLEALDLEWAKIDADAAELGEEPDYRAIERLRSVARNALGLPANHQIARTDLQRPIAGEVLQLLGTRAEYTDNIEQQAYEHLVGRYWSIVESAVLELPHDLLEAGLCIVDLPGSGDTDQGRLDALRKYVDRADQFVLVLGIALVTEDVERLLLDTDLLLKLVARRRPLIVVGTKLDTAGVPNQEDLIAWNLATSLAGLRATEEVWRAKAENKVHDLMRRLIAKIHPRKPDQSTEDYDAQVRAHFDRSEFIPVNPRAALELNAATRGAATDLAVQHWREKYPEDDDLGIEDLRRVLREVANGRRHEYATSVATTTRAFAELVRSEVAHAPHTGEAVNVAEEAEACAKALSETETALDALLTEAQASSNQFVDAMTSHLNDLVGRRPEVSPLRVTKHLEPKHHLTVKASVRSTRNGIWNTIHVPKAMFEALQLQVVERWSNMRDEQQCLVDRHSVLLAGYCDMLERAVGAPETPLHRICVPSIVTGRRVLEAHAESVRRDLMMELTRVGVPLSDKIEEAAREALSEPCREAAEFHGKDTKVRIVNKLAASAGLVSQATVETVRGLLHQAASQVGRAWIDRLAKASRRSIQAVGEDVGRALRSANEGTGHSPHAEVDRAEQRALLNSMPFPFDREEEEPSPVSAAWPTPGVKPFSVLVGSTSEHASVVWEPSRLGVPLNNFGLLVTGDSGTGKTQMLRAVIADAVAQGIPVCIFDFKHDYSEPSFASGAGLQVRDVSRFGLPFNPLALIGDRRGEVQAIRHVHEISEILARVFGLGPIQTGRLRRAMDKAYERCGIQTREHITVTPDMRVPSFSDVVDLLKQDDTHTENLVERLSPLFDLGLFPDANANTMSLARMLDAALVLDFHDLPNDKIKAALAEVVILSLHGYVLRGDQPRELRRLLVLDEAWRVAKSARLQELAREGRAFGVGIVIATQFPGDLPENMTGNLASQLSLHNTDFEHRRSVAQQLCGAASGSAATQVLGEIASLRKHEGFFRNGHYVPYVRVETAPHYARGS